MQALELRKHDLRVELVKRVQVEGRTAESVQRVYHKLLEVQRAETYLRRA
jgi:hypothetical protein